MFSVVSHKLFFVFIFFVLTKKFDLTKNQNILLHWDTHTPQHIHPRTPSLSHTQEDEIHTFLHCVSGTI